MVVGNVQKTLFSRFKSKLQSSECLLFYCFDNIYLIIIIKANDDYEPTLIMNKSATSHASAPSAAQSAEHVLYEDICIFL